MADKVKRLELTEELVKLGIIEIYWTSEKIEIMFTRVDGKDDVIRLWVQKYGSDTINQLHSEVNGSMSNEAFTHLLHHLNVKLLPIWDQIYTSSPTRGNANYARNGILPTNNSKEDDSTKAELALEIAKNDAELFIDEYKNSHAAITVSNHLETLSLTSKRFRDWLRGEMYKKSGRVIETQTLKDVIGVLTSKAEFDNPRQINLNLRVAETFEDGKRVWYYDLTNEDWEFVRITSDGWSIVNNKILFRRFNNHQPQVNPSREYPPDIFDKFLKLINIRTDDKDTKLMLGVYVVYLFIANTLKPVLMLSGEQGAAKTFGEELIKMLVDPSLLKTLSLPRDTNELIQQLSHNYVAFYDNLSLIQDWASDQLCRAVTGSGSSKRVLYTDDDDFIYNLRRAIGFNGINLAATKADLLDRGILAIFERLSDEIQRKPEDIWMEFENMKPQLLGYIFNILVKMLKWKEEGGKLNLQKLPRMAEFAEYGEMVSRLMGNADNAFIDAYYKNIGLQTEQVLESSPIASVLIEFMEIRKGEAWNGTPTELLSELQYVADLMKINTKSKQFPKMPHVLTRRLNELKTNLRKIGIEIETSSKNHRRTIMVCKIA